MLPLSITKAQHIRSAPNGLDPEYNGASKVVELIFRGADNIFVLKQTKADGRGSFNDF